jgi:diguanylate cyclase (GGDEF)-like protein
LTGDRERLDARLDVDAIVREWAGAGSPVAETSRRAIVAALAHELDRPDGPTPSWTDPLYAFDPSLSISVQDGRVLREVLHDHVATLEPAVALAVQHRLGLLVDDLVADATQRHLGVLEESAQIDPLTGLRNRRAAAEVLDATFAHARRYGRPIAVAIADLVGLKRINDSHGHAAGDDALRQFASALSANLRAGDTAFRFGGDEFVVVAPDTTSAELQHLFDRLRADAPAFSVGIAEAPIDGEDPSRLLALADDRMYGARTVARNDRVLNRLEVGLVTFACATVAVLIAEAVRALADVSVHGDALWAWRLVLIGVPVLAAIGASTAGPAAVPEALRRASSLAGIGLLAMVAALAPKLVVSADEAPHRLNSPISAPRTPLSTTTALRAPSTVVPSTVSLSTVSPTTVSSSSPALARTALASPEVGQA